MNRNFTRTVVMASALIIISCLSQTKISSYHSRDSRGKSPEKRRITAVYASDVCKILNDQFDRLASLLNGCPSTEGICALAEVITEAENVLAIYTITIVYGGDTIIGTKAENFVKIFNEHLVTLQNINQKEIEEATLYVAEQVNAAIKFLNEYKDKWETPDLDTLPLLREVNLQSMVNSQYGSLNGDGERQYELKRPRRFKRKCCVLQ